MNQEVLINKYKQKGVNERHINYAIQSVKDKIKREYIYSNLTSDVRKIPPNVADQLLDDIIGLRLPFYVYSKKTYNRIKEKFKYKGIDNRHIDFVFNSIYNQDKYRDIKTFLVKVKGIDDENAEELLKDVNKAFETYFFVGILSVLLLGIALNAGLVMLFSKLGFTKPVVVSLWTFIIMVGALIKLSYNYFKRKLKSKL